MIYVGFDADITPIVVRSVSSTLTIPVPSMAGSIGVKVVIEGEAPKNSKIRKIIADAVTECAANTVKHAEGDTVNIDISKDSKTVIVITNNGKPPKDAVTESGGLLSLRKSVEEEGGSMRIESDGAFRLILEF